MKTSSVHQQDEQSPDLSLTSNGAGSGRQQSPKEATVLTWANLSQLPSYVEIPNYDRKQVESRILHFGPSKFALAHLGTIIDSILHHDRRWGITMASIKTGQNAVNLAKSDGLYVVMKTEDGVQEARVVGSIVGSLWATAHREEIIAKVADESTELITFTITANGYYKTPDGNLDLTKPEINHDLSNPETPLTIYGFLVKGLEKRARAHGKPVVLMSLDNLEANSVTLRRLLLQYIDLVQPSLRTWVEQYVDFPVTLVDRITPDIDAEFRNRTQAFLGGFKAPVLVGAEAYKELVTERTIFSVPPWEKVGVVEVVDDCNPHWQRKFFGLNAAHQIVAITALRLGITYIHEAMRRDAIIRLVDLAHQEYTGFLAQSPDILGPYLSRVRSRFADGSNPDKVSRVAERTTEKVSERLLSAILRGLEANGQVQYSSTFVVAVWALNLGGHDQFMERIECQDVLALKLNDLHRKIIHYARVAASKETLDHHPVDFLKSIVAEIGNVLQDSRFARLAAVEAFIRRLSSALGLIERLGVEEAVEPYLCQE